MIELVEIWRSTKAWAERLICEHLNVANAADILLAEHRGKNRLGNSDWFYRTHGVGVDISKNGNKGGIDFDFGQNHPDSYRLREFMIKQLNDGGLTKRHYRELLKNKQLWKDVYDSAAAKP